MTFYSKGTRALTDEIVCTYVKEAELVALRHVLDACKRDKKEELTLPRHVKRGFVVLQRMLTTCRAHVKGEAAEEAADGAKALGFLELAKAIEELAKENENAEGGDSKKDKKDKKDDKKATIKIFKRHPRILTLLPHSRTIRLTRETCHDFFDL